MICVGCQKPARVLAILKNGASLCDACTELHAELASIELAAARERARNAPNRFEETSEQLQRMLRERPDWKDFVITAVQK